ncbi:hypothetical protein AB1K18_13140 [Peribacillus simplex]|uniref:hypothetical protein n=1 Tax=Peribacillus simplex TaxID=1478 RepID=UPI003B8E8743
MFKTSLSFMFFTLKKFATLLPNNWLAETSKTLTARRAWADGRRKENGFLKSTGSSSYLTTD